MTGKRKQPIYIEKIGLSGTRSAANMWSVLRKATYPFINPVCIICIMGIIFDLSSTSHQEDKCEYKCFSTLEATSKNIVSNTKGALCFRRDLLQAGRRRQGRAQQTSEQCLYIHGVESI